MAAATPTTMSAYLKDMWPSKAVNNLTLDANPTWGIIPKKTDWKGGPYELALGYGNTQGQGAVFGTAQSNKQPTKETKFELTPSTYYSLFSIERQLIRRARDSGAVVEALGRQSKGAAETWKRSNALFLFRNGGGALGVVSSVNASYIVLTLDADVRNFEHGMSLEFSTDDGTGGAGVRVNTGPTRITSIDTVNRRLYFTTANAGGVAAADYVFIAGTYGAVLSGFDGWLPATVTSTSWYGVDRTIHTTRLGGQRCNVGGLSPRMAAMKLAMEIFKAGGKPDTYILGPNEFLNLTYELESVGRIVNTKMPSAKIDKVSFGIAYDAVSFKGPAGDINVICDYNCPDTVGYMLQLNTWRLVGIGDFPYMDKEDGLTIVREPNADAYEGRWVGDIQLGCDAPGWNGRNNFNVAA